MNVEESRRAFLRTTMRAMAGGLFFTGAAACAPSTGRNGVPHDETPELKHSQLLEVGDLSSELVELIDAAGQEGVSLSDALDAPNRIVERYGLSAAPAAADIERLRANLSSSPAAIEIAAFVDNVMIDGRFFGEWAFAPVRVANEIGFNLSQGAVDLISQSGMTYLYSCLDVPMPRNPEEPRPEPRCDPRLCDPRFFNPAAVVLAVVIVMVIPGDTPRNIVDLSDEPKP